MGSETRARLALAALLFATLVSFSQLFAGDAYFGPALLAAILATLITVGARRLGAGTALTLAVGTAALFWYLAIVFEARHLFYGLPTARAARGLLEWVQRARESSLVDFAPVPVRPGYVVLVVSGMWVAATLAELATFRWRRPLLASAGPALLFSIVLVMGNRSGATLLVLLFLTTLLVFWGFESTHRLRSWGRWVTPWGHDTSGPESLTGALARKMGASCLAAAVIAPLLLPALDEGLLAWRSGIGIGSGLGGSGRVNLLVSLAPTLVNQNDQELFRVVSDRPAYWRLTSLADFDGQDWAPDDDNFQPVPVGVIPSYEDPVPGAVTVTQRFHVTGLKQELVPAASRPTFIEFDPGEERESEDIIVDPDTAELRVSGGLTDGLDYEVQSEVPDVTYRQLRRATIGDPGPIFKELPQNISDEVFELGDRWTEGKVTPFEQLVAIQDRLRAFDYSLDVKAEDSSDYLTQFLTETKAGYCQQFATAFAMLARVQGFPARVSVGFLPGSPAGDGSTLVVTGNHAHAWPEVYFEEFGWVRFEPTPRSEATEPGYTVAGFGSFGEGGGGGTGAGGNAAGRGPATRGIGNNASVRDGSSLFTGATGSVPAAPPPTEELAWDEGFDRLARVAVVLIVLFLLLVPLLKEWRTRRRYSGAQGSSEQAQAAFVQFLSDAAELAAPRRRSESATVYVRRLVAANRVPRRVSLGLAQLYDAAEYGPGAVSERDAVEARRLAGELRRALWSSASWWERAVRLFGPASLLPARDPRRPLWKRARAAFATVVPGVTRTG